MNNFEQIGQQLKSARLQKNISLEQISQSTNIQINYLRAIEEGNYKAMPNEFYARAYAVQFAKIVGINPDDLLVRKAEANIIGELEENKSIIPKIPSLPSLTVEKTGLSIEGTLKDRLANNLGLVIFLVAAIIIALGTWFIMSRQSGAVKNATQTNSVEVISNSVSSKLISSVKKKAAKSLDGPDFNGNTANFTFNDDNKDHKVTIRAGSATWITVVLDGNQLYAGTLADGTENTFDLADGQSEMIIYTGNPRETGVSFDDETLHFAEGSPVEINNVTIDRI